MLKPMTEVNESNLANEPGPAHQPNLAVRRRGCAAPSLHSTGMTLVEVLVALVVISVGLLGIAALQITSLRNSQESFLRTQATALADDIIDRMRANRTVALTNGYKIDIGQAITLSGTSSRSDRDLAEWKATLKSGLPQTNDGKDADGSVDVQNNIATVTIQWGQRNSKDDSAMTFTTRTQL